MFRYIFTLAAVSSTAFAKEVKVQFDELKTLVETKNERVLSVKSEADAAQAREGHLGRSFLPKVEAHFAQESFKVGTHDQKSQPDYGAEASVNLYNGGRDRLRESELRARALRKEFEVKTSMAEELARVRELYWMIVFGKNNLRLLREALDTNSANLKAAQRRISSGVATQSDKLEFEMKAIDLQR
ncbi:MAG: TolC family protein, partial [Pseudobdellovibrionaceae bacterium]